MVGVKERSQLINVLSRTCLTIDVIANREINYFLPLFAKTAFSYGDLHEMMMCISV